MNLQHLLAKRHVEFKVKTAFLHEHHIRFVAVVQVLPVCLELTVPQIAPCADTYTIRPIN